MRKAFADAVLKNFNNDNCIFLTGDLGFMALEEVRDHMGNHFINVGVTEQNMLGVVDGLAKESFKTIVYTIAPFYYTRSFEHIKNDRC